MFEHIELVFWFATGFQSVHYFASDLLISGDISTDFKIYNIEADREGDTDGQMEKDRRRRTNGCRQTDTQSM